MRRVVVAMADPAHRELVVATLARAGFCVSAHPDSQAALREAHADRPDAVVLDVVAPGLPVLEACRALRATEHPAPLPIILLAPAALAASALAAGAEDTLFHPFNPTTLVLQLDELLAATGRPPGAVCKDPASGP